MSQQSRPSTTVVCIGAGPAGLTAAYELSQAGVSVRVLEADPVHVGGIARTHEYKGYRFDIGGHRFFSKSGEIEKLWSTLLPEGFLERPRSSKILYRNKFFPYPLKPFVTFFRLGPVESVRSILSYFRVRLSPHPEPKNFEDWIVNRFGKRLFEIFFKGYTEKVWGRPCEQISSDWAEQRVQNFSLMQAMKDVFLPSRDTKTLIRSFRYPRLGPGMLWDSTASLVKKNGGIIEHGSVVKGLSRSGNVWTVTYEKNGVHFAVDCGHVISTMPIRTLCHALSPSPASTPLADKLEYRDFFIVAVMTRAREHFSDQWIYIHDDRVKTCRVQNFKAWSPDLVPDRNTNCYGLEYFCNETDDLWKKSDAELIALARNEAAVLGLTPESDIFDACVVRQKKAYPVYTNDYTAILEKIRTDLSANYPNLHLAGRNGMHRYNNQDHAMMTALLIARNIIAGKTLYDPWKVNQDAGYLETN